MVCSLALRERSVALSVVTFLLFAGVEVKQRVHHELIIGILSQFGLVFVVCVLILVDLHIS